jgi:ABC-type phosphate/phosphonate transport system substrate-binding protein
MPAIASLPQYDLPELRGATDAWWAGLARHLRDAGVTDVPDGLARFTESEASWRDPDLLLTQTCGYPLMTELSDILVPVAAPVYACPGCDGPRYRSMIIVPENSPGSSFADLRGMRAAVNNHNSHSGMNILRHSAAPLAENGRFFSEVQMTGGHLASTEAVQQGRADVAAIDCVTYALLQRNRPDALVGLRVLMLTDPAPSLPYAMRADRAPDERARVRAALMAAATDPQLADVRGALLIAGFELADLETYRPMLAMRDGAAAHGLAEICPPTG